MSSSYSGFWLLLLSSLVLGLGEGLGKENEDFACLVLNFKSQIFQGLSESRKSC